MRMQDTAANCGPASLSNALAALGIARSQAECEVLCKTSGTDGTSPKNLITAARNLGRSPVIIKETRPEVALLMLFEHLRDGRPAVLCVDNGSHWVAAIGTLGWRVLVADPADNELVLAYERGELLTRWAEGRTYYGVTL